MIDLRFGGSGENLSSSSPPGTSLDLECNNERSKKHGAGDHENKREKHKSDSGNKDNNGKVSFQSHNHSDDRQYKSLPHNYLYMSLIETITPW